MAFRVARGLFRLWLVLSVLWIGGVGVVTWRTFPSIPEPVSWGAIPVPEKANPERPPGDELPDAPWVIKQRTAIRFAILLALVPPGLVLAFGSALIWAIRGFR
jgi:hypothetical protein